MAVPRASHAALALAVLAPLAASQSFTLPQHFEALALPGQYTYPVAMDFGPDGTLFVAQKPGTVRVVAPDGQPQAEDFIDLSAEVNNHMDRGLLGLALHPRWRPDASELSWVYLLYTVSPVPPDDCAFDFDDRYSFSRLTRYRAVETEGGVVALSGSRQVLLGNQLADGSVPDCIASLHESHSNGTLRFARDGSLIVSAGDGAHFDLFDLGGNDPAGFDDFLHPVTGLRGPVPKVQDSGAFRAQDPRSLAGKLLRLDPETGGGYPSNPFWNGNPFSNVSRVWALGLRNPFRIALVPGTGALDPSAGQPNLILAADVGFSDWEELDLVREGGENFGWPCVEAHALMGKFLAHQPADPLAPSCHSPPIGTPAPPLLAWHHTNAAAVTPPGSFQAEDGTPLPGFTGNCVIGGDVHPGGAYPAEYAGRMFLGDFGEGWIHTLVFDAQWQLQSVHPFATGAWALTELRCHPQTGDLYALSYITGQVVRFRYGANLTPVAVAGASPSWGPAPLAVQLTGSGSHDPDGDAVLYDWDFGDGSPHSSLADPLHVYPADGLFQATLTVSDGFGLAASAGVTVAAGNGPPTATIVSPLPATSYLPPATLALVGAGSDPEGGPLSFDWTVDLIQGEVVHAGVMLAEGSESTLDIGGEPPADELFYYRIELSVTDAGGLRDSSHVWAYPLTTLRDVTGTALPISRLDALVPPYPVGGGNPDIEILRDLRFPPVGAGQDDEQYDSNHLGAQGNDDWIGFELAEPPPPEFRFVGLTFEEGGHYVHGGWWEDLRVEVREDGEWTVVPGLSIDPPYPFELADQAFFDGLGFQTYALRFEPAHGDAIRLRGNPGGTMGFISCAELRVLAVAAWPPAGLHEISGQGTIIGRVFELDPPGSLAPGDPDPEAIRNGTWAPLDSQSFVAQFATNHAGDQADLDWIGYRFPTPRTFSRLVLQEGRDTAQGGAFSSLAAELSLDGVSWAPVVGATITPPYGGPNGTHYETFVVDFPPQLGRAIRVAGPPAGSGAFITVGELAVYEPDQPDGCGPVLYGPASGANTLGLWCDTPTAPGLPLALAATGAAGPATGALALSFQPAGL
ncbi:MAG TPA: PQQ-dependent sugar dehydrogenase, partial [Planctomycetota bacterium]|nr:PQQ-dependent sugar dehydrogenase [Planctomycetota bacterium]